MIVVLNNPVTKPILQHTLLWKRFQSLGLTLTEAEMYVLWNDRGVFNCNPAMAQKYLTLFAKISKALPKGAIDNYPDVIYRGIGIDNNFLDSFQQGKSIKLKKSILSSWTARKAEAIDYASRSADKNSFGLMIKEQAKNVILYIGPKTKRYLGGTNKGFINYANKAEIIVAGSLVSNVNLLNAETWW